MSSWEHVLAEQNFTYVNHFISINIYDFMLKSNVLFHAINPLNLNVILLSVTNLNTKIFARSTEKAKHIPRCAWYKATDKHLDDCRIMLNNGITDIKDNCDLFLCTEFTCECTQHKQEIDKICVSLIECCIDCSELTIPMTKPNGGTMPGWNVNIKHEREQSLFWLWVWSEMGKPYNGVV